MISRHCVHGNELRDARLVDISFFNLEFKSYNCLLKSIGQLWLLLCRKLRFSWWLHLWCSCWPRLLLLVLCSSRSGCCKRGCVIRVFAHGRAPKDSIYSVLAFALHLYIRRSLVLFCKSWMHWFKATKTNRSLITSRFDLLLRTIIRAYSDA